MNPETHFLIERPFREIVEDLLTALTGGIVNEPIVFDVKTALYPLSRPAQDLRRITGTVNKQRFTFKEGVDYLFSEGDNAVAWEEGGNQPDDETTFHVDYYPPNGNSPLTDINVGSVTRTLGEAIGREIATVYQQINLAYRSGFIDSAEGRALDLVVSILGITRKTKDYAVGLVTFFRDASISGNITIPQGLQLATGKGEALFETTEPRTLQRGQSRIEGPVRAANEFKGEAGRVAADAITETAQPIAGIARITNLEPTILSAEDETDEELRARARAALRALGKATIAALMRVIFEARANVLEVRDPNSPPLKRTEPGTTALLVETEPEKMPSLRGALEETRAAGVLATVLARYVFFKPRIVVPISTNLTAPGKDKVVREIIDALRAYAESLGSGEPATGEAILETVAEVDDVGPGEVRIVDVLTWRTDLAEPNGDALLDALLQTVRTAPASDEQALREAMDRTLSEGLPPATAGRRIPDRGLVQGSGGARATDEEIEAGEFQVVAVVDGEDWWVVLDMEPADVVLAEGS